VSLLLSRLYKDVIQYVNSYYDLIPSYQEGLTQDRIEEVVVAPADLIETLLTEDTIEDIVGEDLYLTRLDDERYDTDQATFLDSEDTSELLSGEDFSQERISDLVYDTDQVISIDSEDTSEFILGEDIASSRADDEVYDQIVFVDSEDTSEVIEGLDLTLDHLEDIVQTIDIIYGLDAEDTSEEIVTEGLELPFVTEDAPINVLQYIQSFYDQVDIVSESLSFSHLTEDVVVVPDLIQPTESEDTSELISDEDVSIPRLDDEIYDQVVFVDSEDTFEFVEGIDLSQDRLEEIAQATVDIIYGLDSEDTAEEIIIDGLEQPFITEDSLSTVDVLQYVQSFYDKVDFVAESLSFTHLTEDVVSVPDLIQTLESEQDLEAILKGLQVLIPGGEDLIPDNEQIVYLDSDIEPEFEVEGFFDPYPVFEEPLALPDTLQYVLSFYDQIDFILQEFAFPFQVESPPATPDTEQIVYLTSDIELEEDVEGFFDAYPVIDIPSVVTVTDLHFKHFFTNMGRMGNLGGIN